jgi:hypothetical protein
VCSPNFCESADDGRVEKSNLPDAQREQVSANKICRKHNRPQLQDPHKSLQILSDHQGQNDGKGIFREQLLPAQYYCKEAYGVADTRYRGNPRLVGQVRLQKRLCMAGFANYSLDQVRRDETRSERRCCTRPWQNVIPWIPRAGRSDRPSAHHEVKDEGDDRKHEQEMNQRASYVEYRETGDPGNQKQYEQHGPNTHKVFSSQCDSTEPLIDMSDT